MLRAALVDAFGGIEAELAASAARPIVRVAMARAMTAALVLQAADAGAQAYVTGQLRAPARDAAGRSGLHVFAVGHRASERWALRQLATRLRDGWPALDVRLAPED
jgi:putative NIF3 family GTP cyclohydrolase 1 type 2